MKSIVLFQAIAMILLSISAWATVDLVQSDSDFIFNPEYQSDAIPVFTFSDEGPSKRSAKSEVLRPYEKGKATKATAFLPKGSFIKNLNPKENSDVREIQFAYIPDRIECSGIEKNPAVQKEVITFLNQRLTQNLTDSEIEGNVKNIVLSDHHIPTFCFRMGRGYALAKYLEKVDPKKPHKPIQSSIKTEATILSPAECVDCKKEKSTMSELKTTAQKVAEAFGINTKKAEVAKLPDPTEDDDELKHPADRTCGATGKPKLIREINVIPVTTEYRPYKRKVPIIKTNSKGEKYREYKEVSDWYCEIALPEGCNEDVPPLQKVAAIANYFQEKMSRQYCKESLEVYYDNCSVWKDLSEEERFGEIKKTSEKVVSALKKEMGKSFSHQMSPELIQCIAKKETGDLDPSKVVELACERRMNPARRGNKEMRDLIGDHKLGTWTSDAIGLGQVRYFSLKDHWRYYLKNDVPVFNNPQNKTYEEIYGSVDKLFDELLDKPEIQIEIIARQLNRIVTKFRNAEGKISNAILSYDANDSGGYMRKVLNCRDCLQNGKGNFNCLKRAQ